MADKESETRVDPELERQLDEAGLDDRPVQAVVYVRAKRPTDPTSVTEAAQRAIEAAKCEGGDRPRPRQRDALHRDGRGRGTRPVSSAR